MKLEIYEQDEEKREKPVRIELQERGRDIFLIAVNVDGDPISDILCIRHTGLINLWPNVKDELGFQLDESGRVKVGE